MACVTITDRSRILFSIESSLPTAKQETPSADEAPAQNYEAVRQSLASVHAATIEFLNGLINGIGNINAEDNKAGSNKDTTMDDEAAEDEDFGHLDNDTYDSGKAQKKKRRT